MPTPPVTYYYEGPQMKTIRRVTFEVLRDTLLDALSEFPEDFVVLRSLKAASSRWSEGKPFLVIAQSKTMESRCQVTGHEDGLPHSGRCIHWKFLVQAAIGNQGGQSSGEKNSENDDDVMDRVRDSLESKYAELRDTWGLYELRVSGNDSPGETFQVLNPTLVECRNMIRMETDEFV